MQEKSQEKFEIIGGTELSGEIEVNGSKNAALKILAALVLSEDKCEISNFPFIEDTERMLEILEFLGAKIERNQEEKKVEINPKDIQSKPIGKEMAQKLRSSILLTAPLLARFGKIEMGHPGGCVIGKRPIDIFLDGFKKMGAEIEWLEDKFILTAKNGKLQGANIFFPKITVTATETLMIAAVLAEGKTVLENCALEPEILILAEYLNNCGAKIKGAGTSVIEIEGVEGISAGEFEIIPDRIETGTFAIMGLATNSEILIKNCNPKHLGAVLPILEKAGAKLEIGNDFIKTLRGSSLKATSIITHEYPGFATDLQPPYSLLMTQAEGISTIRELIFEGRLFFTDSLVTMGANIIMCDPYRVIISGKTKLYGRDLVSPDLRAGITMVIAGMIAEGKTVIDNIYQIDRGYEKIEERLVKLGAKIKRIK